ncbi:Uu.00g038760.m01.CDS01 [Anthostomella pinea]|uniref:protein-histidine N-methyltransferase n=1 Tax=Anthostomella pinea TaxID=933095 RepID=A0AAI8V4Y1_9PEZI|nr:Uu.00g038760.m01.CDS01 [Anthostomella pinea]
MAGQFSFSFSGDDIDDEGQAGPGPGPGPSHGNEASALASSSASAFPVAGKPVLPATRHDLSDMLSKLPSKIAYSTLDVDLDGNGSIRLPRRELWDVRVQLMAEEDAGETEPGLGKHDVKTGVYEGGFKSWESSVDLVKVLHSSNPFFADAARVPRIIELGCGTALPSLALFHWALSVRTAKYPPISIVLADYNPTVLQLVTLPNFILTWALHQRTQFAFLNEAFSTEGELELTPEVLTAFQTYLLGANFSLLFFSGGWSAEFVDLVTSADIPAAETDLKQVTIIIGAETIYSPFALGAFTQTIFSLMEHDKAKGHEAEALVGAKKLYFGVGGSLDDFVVQARDRGAIVEQVREEMEGVRRGVVRCSLPT